MILDDEFGGAGIEVSDSVTRLSGPDSLVARRIIYDPLTPAGRQANTLLAPSFSMANSAALAGVDPAVARDAAARSRRDFLTGVRPAPPDQRGFWLRAHRRAMACRFEITIASEDAAWLPAVRDALDGIDRFEDELSVFRETSTISRINRGASTAPVAIHDDLMALLQHCDELRRQTGGAFDITSTPLSRCWGFLLRQGRLPSPAEIDDARRTVGGDAVVLDAPEGSVRFARPGIELNLGAIGKGYALDRVASDMWRAGVRRALLSAGRSSLLAIGPSPALGAGGEGWEIEVVSPRRDTPLAQVRLRDAALGTSGAGEQFIIVDDVRYGHVIDPRTGWPASGIESVSVIASSAAVADALSTAFLIGGIELAERYCAAHPDVMALITEEGAAAPRVFGQRR
jgi:FAD:protein FMN transferase